MKKTTTISHPLFDAIGVYPIDSSTKQKSQALKYYERKVKKDYKKGSE